MKNTTAIGNQAETIACEWLIRNGYKIIERNYRDRFCEIDIIAKDNDYICFIEVKYRNTDYFGGGVGSVDHKKQRQLSRSAEYWLAKNQTYSLLQPRIDVIAVNHKFQINYIENAVF